ncbi:hypothetical protein DVH24_007815 [Malus domestica]|uniref:Uncharacterized protein n=1 Tax=Malus domestica TaxID=3750 RepID=A0A498JND7_MALDO|nr:hypothetical protein DVH24_007815 [Malus domestica]
MSKSSSKPKHKSKSKSKSTTSSKGPPLFSDCGHKAKGFSLILLQISVFFVSCIAKSLFEDSPTTHFFWVPADLLTAGYSKGQTFSFSSHIDGGVNLICSTSAKIGGRSSAAVVGSYTYKEKHLDSWRILTVDHQTVVKASVVKARLDGSGDAKTVLQYSIRPKSRLSISGEFNTKALDKIPKIGLALSLAP